MKDAPDISPPHVSSEALVPDSFPDALDGFPADLLMLQSALAIAAPEPAGVIDGQARLVWANEAMQVLLGAGCHPGSALDKLLAPGPSEAAVRLSQLFAGDDQATLELDCHPLGPLTEVRLRVTFAPLPDRQGMRAVYLRDITEMQKQAAALARAEQASEHIALHDPLTGLPNRRGLLRQLGELMRRAEEEHRRIGVCMIDLDGFRLLNETRGHPAGDEVLTHCADHLRRLAEPGQVLARMGGDVFVLISPSVADIGAFDAKARRVRDALSREVMLASGPWRLSARLGLAFAEPGETDPATLLTHTEIALADAKSSPGGDVGLFSPTVGQRFSDRTRVALEMRSGLDRGEFIPVFQPQIRLSDFQLEGFEALVRWQHPERGLLEPCYFLPAAEELRLEGEIDAMMIERSLDGLVAIRNAGHEVPRMSLNFSARSIRDPQRIDQLGWALDKRELTPSDVVVEVLESTMIADGSDPAARNIDRLARSGYRVELDDFGTGYAALSNVARLNIHALKIDRSLIQLMLGHHPSAAVVGSIIALARQIGISVIAEGVETAPEVEELTRLGCDLGQGYWFSRPLELAQVLIWLERRERLGQRRLAG